MTTQKDKLIAHLIELIQRPTAKFSRSAYCGSLELGNWKSDYAILEGGVTLTRVIYGNETPSSPSESIDVIIGNEELTIRSRDLALHWDRIREDLERRMAEAARKAAEDSENKQAEAMLKALGIQ